MKTYEAVARSSRFDPAPWDAADMQDRSIRRSIEFSSMASRGGDWIDPHMVRYRRTIIALSIISLTGMALISLFQMGLLRHLPEKPERTTRFRSSSWAARRWRRMY
jgi:hypothetical protein